MFETIFYITGSIFFTLAIAMLAMFIIFTFKILQKIVEIETEVKNAVTEVKIKIAAFSVGIASAIALLEKIVQIKNNRESQKKEDVDSQNDGTKEEDAPSRKIKIKRIFGKG